MVKNNFPLLVYLGLICINLLIIFLNNTNHNQYIATASLLLAIGSSALEPVSLQNKIYNYTLSR